MLVEDGAVRTDQEGFRHAVDAPVDHCAATLIHADGVIGIAELAQETERVLRLVLVVDARDPDAIILRQLHEQRMLLTARHAPRTPYVDQRYLTFEHGRLKAGKSCAVERFER